MNGGSDPYKPYKRLRFCAENSIKLQKMDLFGKFKDHNLARKHGS